MSKQIVLISPCLDYPVIKTRKYSTYNKIWPPLSLAYTAALLEREGFPVKIIDANAERLSPEEVVERMGDSEKIFVTTSTLDRWQCPHLNLEPFVKLVEEIKKKPGVEIYLIGVHGTVKPREIFEMMKPRAIITGEPELTILDICRGRKPDKIRGLAFEKEGKFVMTEKRENLNINSLPIPAFHLLPMKRYFYEFLGGSFALFEGSRSCPFSCTFCLKSMYGPYRKKRPENLIREVRDAVENSGVRSAYFIDLEFTINRDLVEKLCDFLIDKNYDFRWCCQGRLDSVDRKLLDKMKRAGCVLIHYGVESGSSRIMGMINKKITLEQVEKGMKLTKEAGIDTACFFMFGFPSETEEEMEKTIKFAKKLNPTYASFHIAVPYPGTELYEKIPEKRELFPLYYPEHSHEFLKKMMSRAFKKFYLRLSFIIPNLFRNPRFLWKQFKLFTSYI
ncbi:MAG: radical SAM protein [archaeon]|nr:MAG: radical SAM protein [archaeon]